MPELSSETSFLVPILILLAAAILFAPSFRFAGLGSVIGYLVAGLAIGPSGLGLIHDPRTTLNISQLGVVLLLFLIGLSLKPQRLYALRRDIGLIGVGQMVFTAAPLIVAAQHFLHLNMFGALAAGLALAFSATTIAMQLLEERGDAQTGYGRRAFAVLLAQDIAVAPVLALIPLLGGGPASGSLAGSMHDALLHISWAFAALSFVILAGHYALNPLFRLLARAGAREILTAAALFIVLGAAVLMQAVGMSMALGAFLAGLLLSESNFRHQLEADIEPFRGLLMGLFFMSVGMSVDIGLVGERLGLLAGAALAILGAKLIIGFVLFRLTGSSARDSLSAAGVLTPAGEFSFAIFPLAAGAGLMSAAESSLLSALAAITMVAGPFFAKATERVAAKFERRAPPPEGAGEPPPPPVPKERRGNVLVIGFGRFGQIAVQPLLAERIDVTVIDSSVKRIRDAGKFGFKVYYGDGCRLDVLRAAGAGEARIIAICVGDRDIANAIVALARDNFPVAKIFARAYDRIHAIDLLERGADYQIRETLESALSFGGAAIAELRGDPDAGREAVEAARARDLDRLAIQQAGGAPPPPFFAPDQPRLNPEPLVRPAGKSQGLTPESRDIVEGAAE
ncbi:monovalent cation:proton antiporter-2 (CPA2) family protein [Rhodoblastus acidophilus]|uniref:Monovalent cation:proton antiporter-2 (CPA2) family protein n=1 Tax=Candidatus Rhodoblastus alkanivorans TaxID=2954117 RepID=A0ABS9ZAJ1_9HYPH|nr:monovalent cation:proton antiporter-2 (CPA2) family protein [Candidatus Rhodoblastus alkanivorans]MCI4677788.1 monovalent cation:proton antiporter-2 (CPA2) family protein [Candidatus Rhodoblastus alkanivorans]MCI4684714.1 monovalent cation:proton antiporter-2 (CPA2) family protein [Candidatus Rhodoblastus alkanivorans]MDI4642036.1 monovalent cation:proton antiporter-2 (CPA2) family protein [Rhodoblastus acidophilus]